MEKVPAPPIATHSEMNAILKLCVIRPTLGTPTRIPTNAHKIKTV